MDSDLTFNQEIHILPPLSAPSSSSVPPPPTTDGGKPHLPTTFHKLPDFYSTRLNLLILGYIRPEYDYVSLEALIEDIRIDCDVARRSLGRPAYVGYLDERMDREGDGDMPEKVREEREWLRAF